jgi:hypothetical protein
MIRMLLLDPTADTRVLFVLPLAGLKVSDRLTDAPLVLGVGEMSAQSAAAVVWAVGVDTFAALPISAGPPRSQPGEVTTKYLAFVGWISEFHEGAGKADQHFWHARQCMPGPIRARSRLGACPQLIRHPQRRGKRGRCG